MGLFEDDKLKTFKKRLLTVLEEEEVQKKLREVLGIGEAAPAAPVQEVSEKEAGPSERDLEAKEQLIQHYREEHKKDQETICQLKSEKHNISLEAEKAANKCKKLENELAACRAERKKENDTWQEYYQALQQKMAKNEDAHKAQLGALQQQAEKQQKAADEWKQVAAPFGEALALYGKVQTLSPAVRKRVQAYFKVQTPVSFLVSMGEENNLLQLWNIAKEEIKNCSEEDKSTFNALLAYTIDRVNELHETPRYALRQDKPGEKFDDRVHIRAGGSSPHSGPIQEVILLGIDREGKVWKQSVVRV